MKYKVIGLMSGSSLDGLDIAFATYETLESGMITYDLHISETIEFTEKWQSRLLHLTTADALNFAKTNTYFGHYMGELVNNFINKYQIKPDFIASHGHTIFHYPENRITVQIGDGAALAAITNCTVINNFRTHDIAINGEGTPLAPIADKYLFSGYDFYLNIGGIANISCEANGRFVAFDIGAANQIFNPLANLKGLPYDDNGDIARSGMVNLELLAAVNENPFFAADYPKSLDNTWVKRQILPLYLMEEDSIENRLNTACEQLAQQTAAAIQQIIKQEKLPQKEVFKIFVTGGGAFNGYLMERTEAVCNEFFPTKIILPKREIIEFKEALLIGLLGVLRYENRVNVLSSVTGAKRDTVGGAIWVS